MERRSRLELALIVALCGGCTSLAALLYTRASKLTKELAMAKAALEKQTGLRAEERAGRINAERRLRSEVQRLVQGQSEGVPLKIVAYLKSPFKGRCGTPRQGTLAPAAKGQIVLEPTVPATSLDSLNQFSHLWVIFLFHENTRLGEKAGGTVAAKIAPPRLFGKKVGLFSTRSPHRPNPIGLTVVRIEAVKGNTIHISGVDMCHDTPILDVKPYIPFDFVPEHMVPAWVTAEDVPKWDLRISAEAEASLREIAARRRSLFYATYADFVALLRDVLLQDVRSVHQGRGSVAEAPTQAEPYICNIDDIAIEFYTWPDRIEVCRAYEKVKALPPIDDDSPPADQQDEPVH